MITSKSELIERLKDIHVVEINARDRYKDDIRAFHDPSIAAIINQIEQDEEYHIKLLEELIKLLEQ